MRRASSKGFGNQKGQAAKLQVLSDTLNVISCMTFGQFTPKFCREMRPRGVGRSLRRIMSFVYTWPLLEFCEQIFSGVWQVAVIAVWDSEVSHATREQGLQGILQRSGQAAACMVP